MLEETDKEMEHRWAQGYKKRQAHMMGPAQVCLFVCFYSILFISLLMEIIIFVLFLFLI